MLSKKMFEKCMLTLSVYYNNFRFEVMPKEDDTIAQFKYQVWYDSFKHIDDLTFEALIKAYCNSQVYPPSSPTSILQTYKEAKQSNMMSPESAWEIVDDNLKKGIRGYQTFINGKVVYKNDFYEAIKQYQQISSVCKEIESSLADITTDSKKYVRNEFMDVYKRYSEQVTSIGYDDKLKIEGK